MIDKFDQELILQLSNDGRQSYVKIAKSMNVTEATIRKRANYLLDKGIIRIAAAPDVEKFGFHFIAIVGLQVRLSDIRTVGDHLQTQPNICYVANVTGGYEFLIIVVAKTSKEFAEFMEKEVSIIPGIMRTETFVILNTYKGKIQGLDTAPLIASMDITSKKKRFSEY